MLLDVQLPDISGYDVCRYIKQKWPEVMVLMTSATFTTAEHRTRGLDSGADSYLVQPAEPLELAAAVNALLRIRRSEDVLRSLNATLGAQVKEQGVELSPRHQCAQDQRRSHAQPVADDLHLPGLHDAGRHAARRQPRLARRHQRHGR